MDRGGREQRGNDQYAHNFDPLLYTGLKLDIQKTDASMSPAPNYASPSIFDAFTPPVPPLPTERQRTPIVSPMADVFTVAQRASLTKPLPPIVRGPGMRESDDPDERSMVFVERVNSRDPNKLPEPPISTRASKRRSMSVGEAELKKAMFATS